MVNYKSMLAEQICAQLDGMEAAMLEELFEYPPNAELGDLSLPCFKLSKQLRKSPQMIAEQLQEIVSANEYIGKAESVSGYLNVFFDRTAFARAMIDEILTKQEAYGSDTIGEGKAIVIDYSSPNIAKPFHVGHLRSTVIGNAIYQMHQFLGYQCVGVNHLGDWGTQFGKLIVAYINWGDEAQVRDGGITELLRLYVKFHDEADHNKSLEDDARAWFLKLEQGDEQAQKLWKWFVDISMQEFNKIYQLLGMDSFDSYAGESFYNDKMAPIIAELKAKQLLEEDDGAQLVRLDEYNMPPALMLKKDGSSLYHTRDVTAAVYRKETYHFHKAIYVTSYAQQLHFKQWFKIIELMGYDWAEDLIHVQFGQVSLEGASLSTRKGNVVMLDELLTMATDKIRAIIEEKNPTMENKDEVARQVGVGAIIFNDLSANRIKDIDFNWEEALNFDGETGPYVQYTHARACSVLRKANGDDSIDIPLRVDQLNASLLEHPASYSTLKELQQFGERVKQAVTKLEPSVVARYLVDVAQSFNRFYHECPILVDDIEVRQARLALVKSVQITLRNGLRLIGIESPEKI